MAYNKSTGKWDVVRGDCLWNIAKSVYGDPYKWTIIADANGVSRSTALIYPGQHLKLPGKTPGSSSSSSSKKTTSDKVTGKKVKITWFALDAGTERSMFCTWKYDRDKTDHYAVEWWYTTGQGGWRLGNKGDVTSPKQSSYSAPDNAKKVKIKIKPIAKKHKVKKKKKGKTVEVEEYYWTNGEWQEKEWDYSNNPPGVLPSPSFEININNRLTVEFNNIPDGSSGGTKINGTHVQVEIWRDDIKWKTLEGAISNRKAKVVLESVDPGHSYKIRSRALRKSGTTIKAYGFYTDFSDSINSTPIAPSDLKLDATKVVEGQRTVYFIKASWSIEKTAKTYLVEYATSEEYFDTDQSKKHQTSENDGANATLSDIEKGHTYYVRVASVNDKGQSKDWSETKSVTIGSKPQPPTTYSNTTKCVVGEDLNLYWIHNSTDGSLERNAKIRFEITDLAIPDFEPLIKIVTIDSESIPEEDRPKTHTYKINTTDPEWATIGEGFRIKWKVQTAGVGDEASDWSIEREVYVYAKPEVEVDLRNNEDVSVDEVNNFPFYFIYQATPASQTPISYYIEVVSNGAYETIDDVGKVKNIGVGDKIYQKYYDPQEDPWRFMLEMSPNNIDLENDKNYTMNVTVAMNSGLSATSSKSFKAYFEDLYYNVNADLIYNNETLEMNIHPYCFESEESDEIPEGEYTEETNYKVSRQVSTEYTEEALEEAGLTPESEGVTSRISYLVEMDDGEQTIVSLEELEEMGLTPESEGVIERHTYIYTITEEITVDLSELEEIGLTPESEGVTPITKYIVTKLVDGAILSVYRREYDGSFTEIAKNISNEDNLYVTDPHPSLDYARYRVVAKTSDTGAVSFDDIPAYETHEPAVVIQWADEWSQFQVDDEGTGMVEPAWAGSMLKLPYNISISDNKDKDVTLAKYVGRNHPVSYYGTQLGETSTWNIEIPKEDKETLYGIRRLSIYTGDVYVREPSGLGYWANIEVSYNVKYNSLIVPVTFNIKRVEGGI